MFEKGSKMKLRFAIMRKEDASLEDQSLGELTKKLKKLQKK